MFACPCYRKPDLPKLCRFEYPSEAREMIGGEIYGANVETQTLNVYRRDHNFTTIFRQPDGSAG